MYFFPIYFDCVFMFKLEKLSAEVAASCKIYSKI